MARSSLTSDLLATPLGGHAPEWTEDLQHALHDLVCLVEGFRDQPVTPTALFQLEQALAERLQRLGRTTLEGALNQLEPQELPAQVRLDGECYRLRPKSPRRH